MLHRQPFKTLYLIYFVLKLTIKFPYLTLKTLLHPSSKPIQSWSFREWLTICFVREYLEIVPWLHLGYFPFGIAVPDGTFKDCKFVWVPGDKQENIQEPLKSYAEKAGVGPEDVSGFWYFRKGSSSHLKNLEKAGGKEKVVFYLHGGAFFHGSAYPTDIYALIPKGILKHSKTISRAFSLDYRLCSSVPYEMKHPFPTAIIDALAGYRYVLSLGFKSQNVILVGDSAGGNIALALVRYLRDTKPADLPIPGRVLLLSPWADVMGSRVAPTSSMSLNHRYDIFHLTSEFVFYALRSYLGKVWSVEDAKRNPYIASTSSEIQPAKGEYEGYPKTFIIVGEVELNRDDSILLAGYLEKDNPQPGQITLYRVPDAIHDLLIFDFTEPKHTETLIRVTQWIDE